MFFEYLYAIIMVLFLFIWILIIVIKSFRTMVPSEYFFCKTYFHQILLNSIFSRCPAILEFIADWLLPSGILSGMSGTFSNHYRERKWVRGWSVERGRGKEKADVSVLLLWTTVSLNKCKCECNQDFSMKYLELISACEMTRLSVCGRFSNNNQS